MHTKPPYTEFIKNNFTLYDGAMGTLLVETIAGLPSADYHENCLDSVYLKHPQVIADIHRVYLKSGANVIETNTFNSNPFKLAEYGLEDNVENINRIAVRTALETTGEFYESTGIPGYVALSVGPSGYLISSNESSLNAVTCQELFKGYCNQLEPAIDAGAEIILVETGQDLLEVKIIAQAAFFLKKKLKKDNLFIQVQVTIDESGKMVLGSDMTAVLAALEPLPIDALGINCSTGPGEMEPALDYLSQHSRFYVSCLPNAGIPRNLHGKAVYDLDPEKFSAQFAGLIKDYNIEIAGGCCGTTPAHISALGSALKDYRPRRIKGQYLPRLSSQFSAHPVKEFTRPIIIGERLNVQGSKKTRELLLNENYQELIDIANDQVSRGAYLLDLCTANNIVGKEDLFMERLALKVQSNIDASAVIDTTEEEVIRRVMPNLIGRGIINSIHLEGGKEKARRILEIAREHGFMVIALAIDENGMAYTSEDKLHVAEKIIQLIDEISFPRDFLLFDPLVFSLATGDEKYENSAVETLKAIKKIKDKYPEIYTSLGISNVSFGLMPQARKYLNAVYLNEALASGLDFAIYNPIHLLEKRDIPKFINEKALNLIYNRHPASLEDFIAEFETISTDKDKTIPEDKQDPALCLQKAIIQRKRSGIDQLLKENLKQKEPGAIIHDLLLPAMEEVGEKMSTGEIILPYVLQSAEIFKMILDKLAPFFPREEDTVKKKVLLATVYGDIHDIGKNLLGTLLKNSGYDVLDLGKQVAGEIIVEKAREWNPDIIGLSALLVTTSRYMADCVQRLHENNLKIPVIIGGAAVNEQFAERISHIENNICYEGGVYYAKDAFQGIKKIEKILQGRE